jgi:hypothetical protein
MRLEMESRHHQVDQPELRQLTGNRGYTSPMAFEKKRLAEEKKLVA